MVECELPAVQKRPKQVLGDLARGGAALDHAGPFCEFGFGRRAGNGSTVEFRNDAWDFGVVFKKDVLDSARYLLMNPGTVREVKRTSEPSARAAG